MAGRRKSVDYRSVSDEFDKTRYENPIKSTARPELKVPLMEVVDYQAVSKEYQARLKKTRPWVIRDGI